MTRGSHVAAIDDFMTNTAHDLVVILDIDCVPLNSRAIPAWPHTRRAASSPDAFSRPMT